MNFERALLITFLGDFIMTKVLASIVVLVPSATADLWSPPFLAYYVLSLAAVALFTWWYMLVAPKSLQAGIMFGVTGFIVAVATEFVAGIFGTLSQTGSLSAVIGVIPSFLPFIASWTTVIQCITWIVPAAAIGWWLQRKATGMAPGA